MEGIRRQAEEEEERRRREAFPQQGYGDVRDMQIVRGTDVHSGNRDVALVSAMTLIREHQGSLTQEQMDKAVRELVAYINSKKDDLKLKAINALIEPKRPFEPFGPLIDPTNDSFNILQLSTSGQEVAARAWLFAQALEETDQINAKEGIIHALAGSFYSDGTRVCNPGKTARILMILNGRLKDVNLEPLNEVATTSDALQVFFHIEKNRNITSFASIIIAGEEFCNENPNINRDDFMTQIKEYGLTLEN